MGYKRNEKGELVVVSGPKVDEVGNKYGRLTVVSYAGKLGAHNAWNCVCECGKTKVVSVTSLHKGATQSCGCLHNELLAKRSSKYSVHDRRLYHSWKAMLRRCEDEKNKYFYNYGGRGIKVCDEWHDFETFAKWAIGHGYSNELTIDRIDNNGDYNPYNCRWSTKIEQENNKRTNRKVTIDGAEKNLCQWCRQFGINPITVQSRLRLGWDVETAIKTPTVKQSFDIRERDNA